ncbi:recombinase family protein [Amycolatopsis dongchuanensis]|uniref:Resolvase/invertase-type recombinase catalytic domain-containing protein n=1 Tax=Amycolatopsis dongchuanensis TaxID=1070866 RepID=A0ABP8VIN8_9PSEU
MSNNHARQPDPALHASRIRVAVYLVGSGIKTAIRACLGAHPTWRQIKRTYCDPEPGPLATRPELRRALADARAGEFDLLLVDSASQVSRNLNELSEIITELDEAGVAFRSATESHFDTTSITGRAVMRLMAAFAQYEQEHREQVARREARRRGVR